MAERKATNKYYPPDWDPSKGSVNSHKKSHPLRDRARKLDQGILIVRFEMPFNVWCLKCDNHVGMGVRYNAEKSRVGSYYTSPIYKFRMKCRLCDNYFEIQTDPAKFDYVILSGARKQVRLLEETDNSQDQAVIDPEVERRKMTDAMFRLEKKIENKVQAESSIPNLQDLKRWRSRWEDSFSANQLIRSQFRKRRKRIEQRKTDNIKLLKKASLNIPLLKRDQLDSKLAKEMLTRAKIERLQGSEEVRKKAVLNSAIVTRVVKIDRSIKHEPSN